MGVGAWFPAVRLKSCLYSCIENKIETKDNFPTTMSSKGMKTHFISYREWIYSLKKVTNLKWSQGDQ